MSRIQPACHERVQEEMRRRLQISNGEVSCGIAAGGVGERKEARWCEESRGVCWQKKHSPYVQCSTAHGLERQSFVHFQDRAPCWPMPITDHRPTTSQ